MRLCRVLPLVCTLVLFPQPSSAQAAFEGGIFAGAGLFMSSLAEDEPFCTGSTCVRFEEVAMGNALAFGGHLGVRFGIWSVEASGTFIPTEQEFTGGAALSPSVDTNVLVLTGSVLLNPAVENPFFEPFLAVGGGIKRYSPSRGESSSDPTFSAGGGLRIRLSPALALRFEARDHVSAFSVDEGGESSLQNDVVISAGLSFQGR